MRTYENSVVNKFSTDTNGNAGAGSLVTVYNSGGLVKASLFSTAGAAITNPLAADEEGNYSFKVADGTYDLVINEGALSETKIDKIQIAEIVGLNTDNAHYPSLSNAAATNITLATIITTAGYFNSGDGGGAEYTVVSAGTGPVDGGLYINMLNGLQLERVQSEYWDVREFGGKGDGSDATTAIQVIKDIPQTVYMPKGTYLDSRNGEGYIYSNQLRTDGGDIRYAKGGTLDLTNDPTPVMMIEKIINTNKTEALSGSTFDGGALIVELHKKGGDALVCGMTSNVQSVKGGGDTIGGHFRASGFEPEISEIFGGWIYADANPTDSGKQILETIGLEINMRNQGKVPDFNVEVLPPGSLLGDYRVLNVLTADGSNGVNVGIDIGAQRSTGSDGYFMGIRLRSDGCVPSAGNTPLDVPATTTCQICIQGSTIGPSSSYAGINMPLGNFTWGINLDGGIYNTGAINVPSNQGYHVGGIQVVRSQRPGFGGITGVVSGSAWDTSTITLSDLARKVGAAWKALEDHGLIGA